MTTNSHRNLANRYNVLKSAGPQSVARRRASSLNTRKHGLNSTPCFESPFKYQAVVHLIAEEGVSAFGCADVASRLLNYRRVMDAYTSPVPVDEFLPDMYECETFGPYL
ncbi:hypothetical protein N9H56_01275 [Pseudomonadales bacterium]|nr:hypothetical protein [Pseudomonadales bacterium]